MKDRFFPHDFNARGDEKISRMIRAHGWQAYGIYWAVVERLYENGGKIAADFELMAYDLRVEPKLAKSIISDYDLFYRIGSTSIGSRSVDRRLRDIQERRQKAKEAGRLGGLAKAKQPSSGATANAKQERKGKETERKVDTEGTKQQLTALIASVGFNVEQLESHRLPDGFSADSGRLVMDLEPSRCQWYLDSYMTLDSLTRAALLHRIKIKSEETAR